MIFLGEKSLFYRPESRVRKQRRQKMATDVSGKGIEENVYILGQTRSVKFGFAIGKYFSSQIDLHQQAINGQTVSSIEKSLEAFDLVQKKRTRLGRWFYERFSRFGKMRRLLCYYYAAAIQQEKKPKDKQAMLKKLSIQQNHIIDSDFKKTLQYIFTLQSNREFPEMPQEKSSFKLAVKTIVSKIEQLNSELIKKLENEANVSMLDKVPSSNSVIEQQAEQFIKRLVSGYAAMGKQLETCQNTLTMTRNAQEDALENIEIQGMKVINDNLKKAYNFFDEHSKDSNLLFWCKVKIDELLKNQEEGAAELYRIQQKLVLNKANYENNKIHFINLVSRLSAELSRQGSDEQSTDCKFISIEELQSVLAQAQMVLSMALNQTDYELIKKELFGLLKKFFNHVDHIMQGYYYMDSSDDETHTHFFASWSQHLNEIQHVLNQGFKEETKRSPETSKNSNFSLNHYMYFTSFVGIVQQLAKVVAIFPAVKQEEDVSQIDMIAQVERAGAYFSSIFYPIEDLLFSPDQQAMVDQQWYKEILRNNLEMQFFRLTKLLQAILQKVSPVRLDELKRTLLDFATSLWVNLDRVIAKEQQQLKDKKHDYAFQNLKAALQMQWRSFGLPVDSLEKDNSDVMCKDEHHFGVHPVETIANASDSVDESTIAAYEHESKKAEIERVFKDALKTLEKEKQRVCADLNAALSKHGQAKEIYDKEIKKMERLIYREFGKKLHPDKTAYILSDENAANAIARALNDKFIESKNEWGKILGVAVNVDFADSTEFAQAFASSASEFYRKMARELAQRSEEVKANWKHMTKQGEILEKVGQGYRELENGVNAVQAEEQGGTDRLNNIEEMLKALQQCQMQAGLDEEPEIPLSSGKQKQTAPKLPFWKKNHAKPAPDPTIKMPCRTNAKVIS